jgi:hypothetical protein
MKIEDRPRVILSAEEELGITAGLQDRVAQVYGGLVYMVLSCMQQLNAFLLETYFSQETYHEVNMYFWFSYLIFNAGF